MSCVKHPDAHYCTACFSSEYPMEVNHPVSKFALERCQSKMLEQQGEPDASPPGSFSVGEYLDRSVRRPE